MASTSTTPSLETLKQAITIAEKIQRLEADLATLLGGNSLGAVAVSGKKRGRPAKVAVEAEVEEKAPKAKKTVGKKRTMSVEGRQRIIEAQKKRWAGKKKA